MPSRQLNLCRNTSLPESCRRETFEDLRQFVQQMSLPLGDLIEMDTKIYPQIMDMELRLCYQERNLFRNG